MQQMEIRDNEQMAKRHGDEKDTLEEKFKKEDKEGHKQLANLKEMTKELARDLDKLNMDPDNDAS